ncbi:MAG: PD-(D/E)XK nuclease family protein, partial [bacterium]
DHPPPLQLSTVDYDDWREYLTEEYADATLITRRAELMRGEVLHRILSQIGNLWGVDLDETLSRAVAEASRFAPSGAQLKEAAHAVRAILESPKARPFFWIDDGEVYTEKEMADSKGRMGRVDRLIVKEREVWIIDFKSSGAGGAVHREQVARYLKMTRELYPGRKVRGFLVFMDEVRVEKV